MSFLTSQLAAELTTIIIFVLTLVLALIITKRYFQKRSKSLLFWSMGLWAFVIGVLLEIVFALGIYSNALIAFYLFIVGVLVELLALGSMQLVSSSRKRQAYYAFCIISTVILLYSVAAQNIGSQSQIITNYIVYGNLPLFVVLASSLVTFPAAIILVVVAYLSYRKTKNKKLLSIIAGVVIVSIAGTLYIIQYPAFLYLAEFLGILLLWYGFI